MRRASADVVLPDDMFQSSPGLEAGCDGHSRRAAGVGVSVSILTRLGGRVRLAEGKLREVTQGFQSSPGLEAGCDTCPLSMYLSVTLFQSSPGLEAGCDSLGSTPARFRPMFQSSPGLEAGCDEARECDHFRLRAVSILTRLGGRVRPVHPSKPVQAYGFQSSPGLEAGCDATRGPAARAPRRVSILTRLGGRVRRQAIAQTLINRWVSILTRLGGRVRRPGPASVPKGSRGFNPHPAWRPGATLALQM